MFESRLMNLHAAATYIGVSYWTMRDYVADGIVPHFILPCSRHFFLSSEALLPVHRTKGAEVIRG